MDRGWDSDFVFNADCAKHWCGIRWLLLLLLSSGLIGLWAHFGRHRGIMFLQLFYATAGFIGMVRWF